MSAPPVACWLSAAVLFACVAGPASLAAADQLPCTINVHPGPSVGRATLRQEAETPTKTQGWPTTVLSLHDAARALQGLVATWSAAHRDGRVSAVPDHVVVCLASGVHRLGGKPLILNGSHASPGLRVTWRGTGAASGPAVVSGGVQLSAWVRCNDGVHCPGWEGVWVNMISEVAGLPPAMLPVRQLWVDNATRATPAFVEGEALGLVPAANGYTVTSSRALPSMVGAEMRWPRQIRNWIEPRCRVVNQTQANGTTAINVDPACWSTLTARNGGQRAGPPAYIDNVLGPDSTLGDGEFLSGPQYLFYRPTGDFPYTQPPRDAWVPAQETLVSAANLSSHTWENVQFSYSGYMGASRAGGYVPSQSAVTDVEPEGAVKVSGSENIVFQGCTFSHLGSLYGLSIGNASQNVVVRDCSFTDISGGAVKLGNVNDTRAVTNATASWDTNYTVENNIVTGTSREYRGASAVFAGYVAHTVIQQNTIRDTGYTGISLGWGWGRVVSFARDNHVRGNYLSNVMSALNDGGCIYTLGPQPGSTVSNNYCRSDSAPVVGCFYHDNGSRYFNTTKCDLLSCSFPPNKLGWGAGAVIVGRRSPRELTFTPACPSRRAATLRTPRLLRACTFRGVATLRRLTSTSQTFGAAARHRPKTVVRPRDASSTSPLCTSWTTPGRPPRRPSSTLPAPSEPRQSNFPAGGGARRTVSRRIAGRMAARLFPKRKPGGNRMERLPPSGKRLAVLWSCLDILWGTVPSASVLLVESRHVLAGRVDIHFVALERV